MVSLNDPWCPTCAGRKGHTIVCEACWQRLPHDLRADYEMARSDLDRETSRCLTWLSRAASTAAEEPQP